MANALYCPEGSVAITPKGPLQYITAIYAPPFGFGKADETEMRPRFILRPACFAQRARAKRPFRETLLFIGLKALAVSLSRCFFLYPTKWDTARRRQLCASLPLWGTALLYMPKGPSLSKTARALWAYIASSSALVRPLWGRPPGIYSVAVPLWGRTTQSGRRFLSVPKGLSEKEADDARFAAYIAR